jgi:hypothetical protein
MSGRPVSEALSAGCSYRTATSSDALCLGVLATQVFLDTYATEGIRADLAREVLNNYSPEVFAARLADRSHALLLAERAGHLVGFADATSHVIEGEAYENRVLLKRLVNVRRSRSCRSSK